ncbi:Mediator of RNA polymerase II transcription subunit-like protein [Emericellopsis cladophorae]|uniref:Mediator of RNA polymerase II transcription subunit 16 n=1 Tax=Emericellopsis cladophorae TaxID=2686198 RepID=A0A9Q0BHX2_9HYPO|nr:Mediator of RNA polymerase II transcription subunit-like protein [Emericellopsis cladophorae]KAI6785601.1 Mediator of RNA polymerase II transcription subunit-like protein [Emericellopsis cladophorae]
MAIMLNNDMPMSLDNTGGDMADLFGDATGLPLPPASKQLESRLDWLRCRGCCKTIAWSKIGTIASITPNGQEIEIRYLHTRPDNGEWDLSDPIVSPLLRGSPENPLVHLEWAETNNPELAVFDNTGRVAIIVFAHTVNQSWLTRSWNDDAVDAAQAIAGSYWLPVNPSTGGGAGEKARQSFNVSYGPATKAGGGKDWSYESSFIQADTVSHPQGGRSALLTVTTGGMVKMFWMQGSNQPEETRLELESFGNSDEIITHAAFAAEKKEYVELAYITTSRQLKLVKIDVQWGTQQVQSGGHQGTRHTLKLSAKNWAMTQLPSETVEDISMPHVTQMLLMPSILDDSGKDMLPPLIISIRARSSGNGSFAPTNQSVINRWEAVEKPHALCSGLDKMRLQRNGAASEVAASMQLQPLEQIVLDKCVVGVQSAQFGKVIVLAFSDGSSQYRDRFTFAELYAERSLETVQHLRQVGWTFPDDCHCQQIAFSPSHFSMIQLGDNGKVHWSKLTCGQDNLGSSMKDRMIADWFQELTRILSVQTDYVPDQPGDALLKNAQLAPILSIGVSLGYHGDLRPRSFQSKFAMLCCTIRNVAFNITITTNAPFPVASRKSLLDDHEIIDFLASTIKWSLDLLSWISSSLFELMHDAEFMARLTPERSSEMGPYLEKQGEVALQLLMCSTSRAFLASLCRKIAYMGNTTNKAMEYYQLHPHVQSGQNGQGGQASKDTPGMRSAFVKLHKVFAQSPIKVGDFEKLNQLISQGIAQAYDAFLPKMARSQSQALKGKEEDEAIKALRAMFETQMLTATVPVPGFLPLLRKLFHVDLPAYRKTTDMARLFFDGYSILTVQGDESAVKGVRLSHIDAFSKQVTRMDAKKQWRRCVRCTSIMEDHGNTRSPGLTFMAAQMRRCPCSGSWALLPAGKVDA